MNGTKPAPKGLKFYEASHRYKLDGEWVPGVTSIVGVLNKEAIPKWAAGEVAEFVADYPSLVDLMNEKGGRNAVVRFLKDLPWDKRDSAAKRGSVLHDYAENLLNGERVEVAAEHVPVMESALAFMEDWQIEPLLVEACVASRRHKWAGKLDLIAKYVHPETRHSGVGIFDWKSGKALYPEYAWQLNAYAHAEFTGLDGDEKPLPGTFQFPRPRLAMSNVLRMLTNSS